METLVAIVFCLRLLEQALCVSNRGICHPTSQRSLSPYLTAPNLPYLNPQYPSEAKSFTPPPH